MVNTIDEKPTQIIQEYRFDVTLDELKKAVIKGALRVLKEYGIRGYDGSWMSEEGVFPIRALLILLDSAVSFDEETDSYCYYPVFHSAASNGLLSTEIR